MSRSRQLHNFYERMDASASVRRPPVLARLGILALAAGLPGALLAQSAAAGPSIGGSVSLRLPETPALVAQAQLPNASQAQAEAAQQSSLKAGGAISGTVLDGNGAVVPGATVTLENMQSGARRTGLCDSNGYFRFQAIEPGGYRLSIARSGFAPWTETGIPMQPGLDLDLPAITLKIASASSDVVVSFSPQQLASEQIHAEEKQRILGVIPNFYTSYIWRAESLTPGQKFQLAWRSSIDWEAFAASAAIAGVQQGTDSFEGYGQGVPGYAKRFAASYSDGFIGTMIGSAILPTLLHQDPRYFYKGTGTIRERAVYAIATTVICRGDNGGWQPNYSNLGGNLAAGAISNLYYPKDERSGIETTVENALIGTAGGAISALIQEFLLKKLTPGAGGHDPP